jgi:hypothetical protein
MRVARLLAVFLPAAALTTTATAQPNLLTNGGFEFPVIPTSDPDHLLTFLTGENVGGWAVAAGDVEILDADRIQPAEGFQSLDLNGGAIGPGTIYQDVATIVGGVYDLAFALSGNPFPPNNKTLNVLWGPSGSPSSVVGSFTFVHSPTQGPLNMEWEPRTRPGLIATHTTMRLTFQSTTPFQANAGPFLDDISLTAVPEPSTVVLVATGLLAAGGLAVKRKQL